MAEDNKVTGCLKFFIGLIVVVIGFAFIYFILLPLTYTILPLVVVGTILVIIVVGIMSALEG